MCVPCVRERRAGRRLPEPGDDGEVVLEPLEPLTGRRERDRVGPVLVVEPAGADPQLHPTPAHRVDLRDRDGEGTGVPEGHRRDQRAQADGGGLAGDGAQGHPGVGRARLAGARAHLEVVVRAEEGVEAQLLGRLGHRQLGLVGGTLLGLDEDAQVHGGDPTGEAGEAGKGGHGRCVGCTGARRRPDRDPAGPRRARSGGGDRRGRARARRPGRTPRSSPSTRRCWPTPARPSPTLHELWADPAAVRRGAGRRSVTLPRARGVAGRALDARPRARGVGSTGCTSSCGPTRTTPGRAPPAGGGPRRPRDWVRRRAPTGRPT